MRPAERRPAHAPAVAFSLPVRVYYQDTDAGGVVYHGTYLNYFERARTEWLRAMGLDIRDLARRDGILFIVRELRIGYARPALLDDPLRITVAVQHVGRAQFTLLQQAGRDDEVLAEAAVNLACVAAGTFRPLRLPEALRGRLLQDPSGASPQLPEEPE